MATQILEASASPGETTLTGRLFVHGADIVIDSVVGVEKTNDKGRYRFSYTDLPEGTYRMSGRIGTDDGFINEVYDVLAASGVYFPRSENITPSIIGAGSVELPITVTKDGNPVDGAEVWITTDEAGTNVIAGTLTSDAMGNTPNFMLDPGTYYVWVQKSGVNFTNPTEIEVS